MKVAVICLVLFGLIAAACAAVLVATLARPAGPVAAKVVKGEPDVDVLVAKRDLQAQSVVDGDSVVVSKVPKSQVPQNALLNPVQVVGKVLTDRMLAGQAFTKASFAREGTGVYLATALPPGKRAMSISLTDWSGMAGLLYPGSVVDVLVSFKSLGVPGRSVNAEMMSTTLLQGLQVLAIGSQSIAADEYKDKQAGALAQRGQINTRMVTLLVDPKQAEILQLALQAGSISLAMRNPLDVEVDGRRLTRAREISPVGGAAGVASAAAAAADPFDDAPEAGEPQEAVKTSANANEWATTIIRGKSSEIRTFALPRAEGATAADAGDAAPAVVPPTDAEPAADAEPVGEQPAEIESADSEPVGAGA